MSGPKPPPPTARFSKGEKVFLNHKTHAWVVGDVQQVEVNPKPVPMPPHLTAGARKREHSALWHIVCCNDALMGVKGEVVGFLEDWNVEIYDEAIEQRPVDDLLSLVHLHDAAILRTLAVRYFQNIIYTNIGVIVVAVNPFNVNIPRYQDAAMGAYLAERGQPISDKLLPHSWSQAHNTYHELTTTHADQSILISGESGAGKTEAAKIVLKYLTHISAVNGTAVEQQRAQQIATVIASCSPILEAFGNAKTVRNDNSSRFGKLLKLQFHPRTHLFSGAHTVNYLLEKSRVLVCGRGERVYHSFYLAAASSDGADVLELRPPLTHYVSLYSGSTLENKEYSTPEDYTAVSSAMERVGISMPQRLGVWRTVSGILHLANVKFLPSTDGGEGSTVDPTTVSSLTAACRMWGVSLEALQQELASTELTVMGSVTRRLLHVHKAVDVRDALCKAVYSAMFEWLVAQCNTACLGDIGAAANDGPQLTIALLDIFGFESFDVNSFEQLCINYANETLQQHYNTFVFTKDMELCRNEGIDSVSISCPDLQPTLHLMQRIFSALDDQCALNGSEAVFLEEMVKAHHKVHPSFLKDLTKKGTFGVAHFAGDVTYDVAGWIEKNRDTVKDVFRTDVFPNADNAQNALSSCLFTNGTTAADMVPDVTTSPTGPTARKKAKGPLTVACSFRAQMDALLQVIEATNPRWIRCVKPHPEKVPLKLSGSYTLRQLEFSGILGTVKVRKAGYPIRYPHRDFCTQFRAILPFPPHYRCLADITAPIAVTQAKAVLTKCELLQPRPTSTGVVLLAQMGTTLVFLKSEAFYELERWRKRSLHERSLVMQQAGRGFLKRLRVSQLRKVLLMQRIGRMYLANVLLHRSFVLVNAVKIAERKREREEAERVRKADEKRRALERERREKEEAELMQRRLTALRAQLAVVTAEEERVRRDLEGSAAITEHLHSDLFRLHQVIDQANRKMRLEIFLRTAVAPLDASRSIAREKLLEEEALEYRRLRHLERQVHHKIWIREELIETRRAEIRHRAAVIEEYEEDLVFLMRVQEGAWNKEHFRKRKAERQQRAYRDAQDAPPPGPFVKWVQTTLASNPPHPPPHPSPDSRGSSLGSTSIIPASVIADALHWEVDLMATSPQLQQTLWQQSHHPRLGLESTRSTPQRHYDAVVPGARVFHVPTGLIGRVDLVMPKGLAGSDAGGHHPSHIVSVVTGSDAHQTTWVDMDDLQVVRTVPGPSLTHRTQAQQGRRPATPEIRGSQSPPRSTTPRGGAPVNVASSPPGHFRSWKLGVEAARHEEIRTKATTDLRAFSMWQQRAALLEDD